MDVWSLWQEGCCIAAVRCIERKKQLESAFTSIQATIRTFDEESNVIDTIKEDSIMIERDTKFDISSSEGSNKDSLVIKITIGKKRSTL